jgi:hypothetical protein
MRIVALIAAVQILVLCVTASLAMDISGRWQTEFSTNDGTAKYFYELKADGEKITGKSTGRVGEERPEAVLKEGKIKGDDFSWLEFFKDADGKEIKVETKGKIQSDGLVVVRSPSDADPVKATLTRVSPPSALAKTITGKWTAEFDSPIGTQKYTYELKVDGDKMTGKCIGEAGEQKRETTIAASDIRGNEVYWVEIFDYLGTPTRIESEGEIVNADQIKVMRRFGSYGLYEITLTRVKDTSGDGTTATTTNKRGTPPAK